MIAVLELPVVVRDTT